MDPLNFNEPRRPIALLVGRMSFLNKRVVRTEEAEVLNVAFEGGLSHAVLFHRQLGFSVPSRCCAPNGILAHLASLLPHLAKRRVLGKLRNRAR